MDHRRNPKRIAEVGVLALLCYVLVMLLAVGIRTTGSAEADVSTGEPPATGLLTNSVTVAQVPDAPLGTGGSESVLDATTPRIYVTTADERFAELQPLTGPVAAIDRRVQIDPTVSAQQWRGVGAALTDASVSLLRSNPEATEMLFGGTYRGGARLDVIRLPLSATDFSTRPWVWELDGSSGSYQPSAEALDAVALIDAIRAGRDDVTVIAASWTAPAHMRTQPGSLGGALRDTALDEYGDLLVGQVEWLLDRSVPIVATSLGNEPGHLDESYPTLLMSDAQMRQLAATVSPRLDDVGVELWALDHNWSDAERARNLVAGGDFDAVGFHCYDGSARDIGPMPVPHILTECTATDGDWWSSVGWMSRELVGDAVAAGSTGLVMWNLALDERHGPKAPGGCESCRGLVTIGTETGVVTPSPEFDVLAHLSHAADPGAAVVPVDQLAELPLAVFVNPDGTVGVFGHNDTPTRTVIEFDVGDTSVVIDIAPWGVFSFRG